MKISVLALLIVLSLNCFATTEAKIELNENIEIVHADENFDLPKTKISDVKELLSTMNPDATCMDEYLKRRKQLILKLSLSPITIVAGTASSGFIGALGGSMLASALYDKLFFAVTGLLSGFAIGSIGTVIDTNMAAFQLADIDTIVKALAEQHRNQSGKKSEKLYASFIKKKENPASKEEFFSKLMEMDANGKLCDGSLVKQPKFKFGSKLKFKVSRTEHLRKAI